MRRIGNRCGRWGRIAAGLVLGLLLAGAARAEQAPTRTPRPSYAIANIVAVVMCLTVLAIPCKRFRRI
ncbi:MAG: hypothetical protein WBD63_11155 [Phycisphaerae bacterium]|nr:hypothetical protein [Phycisphaerae bacterium]